ncbi:MAG: MFS transporter [Actinomycetaceae bacterium]|nr:MFS transporter [Actinomycetaceae bacterium]
MDTKPQKPPLWTASFTLLTLANFGLSMAFFALMATMATHAITSFAANNTEAGLVNSVFVLGAMVSRFVAGRLIELKGYRPVMIASLILHAAAIAAYFTTTTLTLTLIVRSIHGIGFGLSQTAVGGTVMSTVPDTRRAEGSGWFTTGMSIATGLAPFLGIALHRSPAGQTGVFALATSVAVASLIAALLARPDSDKDLGRHQTHHQSRAPKHLRRKHFTLRANPINLSGFVDRRAFPIGAVVALCAFTFGSVLTFLDGFAKEAGLAEAAAWYFVVYAVVIFFSRPLAGMAQDKWGDHVVVIPLIIALILGMIATALAHHPATLLLGAALLGLGYGTVLSAGQAIAVARVGAARAGLAVASYFLLVDFGTGVAPALLGILVDPLGYRKMMLVAAALAGLALVGYVIIALVERGRSRGGARP